MIRSLVTGAAGACLCFGAALAHVTLEQRETPVGAAYKAVVKMPHGCNGSPTIAIRVKLPAGVIAVKPMPKPGWKLDVVTGKYPKPYTLRGAPVSEGVSEIAWSGGKLLDAHYDEFVFISAIAGELAANQTIYFPVVQECETGVHRWIEIPSGKQTGGQDGGGGDPAPGLRLLPRR